MMPSDSRNGSWKVERLILLSVIGFAIALGIVFRFSDLDRKFFYGDEVVSSLRESGHTEADFSRDFDGRVRTVRDVSRYLSDRSTSPNDTIRSLVAEDPQHPPLYYLAARYWTQAFGDTIATRRSLAALFGSLAVAAVFWLGYELFGSLTIAAIASALVATSPFHVIYAQQNREYSAWLFFLALQGALLLRALRSRGALAWSAYAAALAAALYTDALVLYDLVAMTLFVILRERRWSANLKKFAFATGLALLAYGPWLLVMYRGARTITGWMGPLRVAVSPAVYVLKWIFNTAAVFFDSEYEFSRLIPIAILVLIIVAASFVVTAMKLAPEARLFVFALTFVPAVAFIASDMFAHTSRATAPRYLVAVWLGCELAVAFMVGRFLLDPRKFKLRAFGAGVLIFLLGCGLGSNFINVPAQQTSATGEMGRLGPEARAINTAIDPLVVYVHDGERWDIAVAMLATVLRPDVHIQLFERLEDVRIHRPQAGYFLYAGSPATKATLEKADHGRWLAVRTENFGSQLVKMLRNKASQDRSRSRAQADEDIELWQRLPDRLPVVRSATDTRALQAATNGV